MTNSYAYLEECRRRELARPALERAREVAGEAYYDPGNQVVRANADVLIALAQAEALDRIATALEKAAAEFNDWRGCA